MTSEQTAKLPWSIIYILGTLAFANLMLIIISFSIFKGMLGQAGNIYTMLELSNDQHHIDLHQGATRYETNPSVITYPQELCIQAHAYIRTRMTPMPTLIKGPDEPTCVGGVMTLSFAGNAAIAASD